MSAVEATAAGAAPPALMAGAPPFGEGLVTLANWQDPPYNRWSFQHVRELIPTACIRRGNTAPVPLPHDERDVGGVRFRSGGRDWDVARMLAETFTDGFIVVHRGRVLTERYFNGMTRDTTHLLMSVSKSVVATVVGILAAGGRLDRSAELGDIVPELRATSFADATVQHLLDMRTGTRFDEDYDNLEADVRTYERVYLWRPDDGGARPPDALSYYETLVNDDEHGGRFRYRSILTDVLGWVAERSTGQRLHDLIASLVWEPMGAEYDAEITVDAHGNPMADGGICTTLVDMARFGLLYASGSGHVVPLAWVEDTARGAGDGAAAFAAGYDSRGWPAGAHYRNCWWVRDPTAPFLVASGIYGQEIYVLPAAGLVVAKLSTWPSPLSPELDRPAVDAVRAIARELGEPVPAG